MFKEFPGITNQCGSLRIAASEEEIKDCRVQFEMMKEDGFPVEWYKGSEGEGLLIPTDGTFNPMERCRALANIVMKLGARLYCQTKALDVSGTQVTTANGVINCRRVIVAVDGKLEEILPELKHRVRTTRL